MSRQQPYPSGWSFVKQSKLTSPSAEIALAFPASDSVASDSALLQELETMEARLRDLNNIFEHLHDFHSWLSRSSHQLAVDVQKVDPRVRGTIQPFYRFDNLDPKIPPGFLTSRAPGPRRSRNSRLLRCNQLRADECERRLSQTRIEYRYCQNQLQTTKNLVLNLQTHKENETRHVLNQMCITTAQPILNSLFDKNQS